MKSDMGVQKTFLKSDTGFGGPIEINTWGSENLFEEYEGDQGTFLEIDMRLIEHIEEWCVQETYMSSDTWVQGTFLESDTG